MQREVPDFQQEQLKKNKNKSSTSRRGFLRKIILGLGTVLASFFYLRFEANWLEVTKKKVLIPKLRNKVPIKLLHLSDLHFSNSVSLEDIDFAFRQGFSLSPDACVITGDFITDQKSNQELEELGKLLRMYANIVPTFASLGNHDGGEWAGAHGGFTNTQKVESMLARAGIKLLHNQKESIYLNGQSLTIAGVGDLWSKTCRPERCLTKVSSRSNSGTSLVLCHNPDAKKILINYKWDLMLCGHTHGGQLKIPFLGWTPFAPVQDHSLVEGLHSWKERQIHITRGVGNLWGVRLNCRPEVSLLELSST
ncbi:MAG: phosphodiesterase YaeI [Opitutales bacterium]|nr:phosphodiesterase YaeI [Opitutales bacterium]